MQIVKKLSKNCLVIYLFIFILTTLNYDLVAHATVFEDGFESSNFYLWTGTSHTWGEKATTTTTYKLDGARSATFSSNGESGYEMSYAYKTITASNNFYVRGYIYVFQNGIVQNNDKFQLVAFQAGNNAVAYAGWYRASSGLRWFLTIRSGTSYVTSYSTNAPESGKWYSVELHWKKGTTDGTGELYVDGTRVCTISGRNTGYFGDITQIRMGLPSINNCGATRIYLDCVIMSQNYIGVKEIAKKNQSGIIFWTSRDTYGFEGGVFTIDNDGNGQVALEDGTATFESNIVYKGSRAVRLEAGGRAQIGRWGAVGDPNAIRNQVDAYYGWALYIGSGYSSPSWSLIAQLHIIDANGQFTQLELDGATPKFRLVAKRSLVEYRELWNDPNPAPLGSWFTLIIHLVAKDISEGGKIEVWINKNPFTVSGAGMKIGTWSLNLKSPSQWAGPGMCADVYQDPSNPRNWIVVDEMICASTLESVVGFLSQ